MIKNEAILASIYMIQDYQKGSHFLEETVDRVVNELKLLDAELEALQSRNCEGCKYGKERYWDWDSGRYDKDVSFECKILDKSTQLTPYSKHEENKFYCSPTFCCNRYEAKEQ